jgi:hypothetical protein
MDASVLDADASETFAGTRFVGPLGSGASHGESACGKRVEFGTSKTPFAFHVATAAL